MVEENSAIRLEVSRPETDRLLLRWSIPSVDDPDRTYAEESVPLGPPQAAHHEAPSDLDVELALKGAQILALATPAARGAPMLLEVKSASLRSVSWESILRRAPFGIQRRRMFRYSPDYSDISLVPLEMPLDVLLVDLDTQHLETPNPRALKHFRSVYAQRTSVSRLRRLTRAPYDIIHIRTRGTDREPSGIRALYDELSGQQINRTFNAGNSTRLVLIECAHADNAVALQVAHSIMGRSGPAVIVAPHEAFNIERFYYDITHSLDLASAFERNRRGVIACLLLARGSEHALDLRESARVLWWKAELQRRRVQEAVDDLAEMTPEGVLWKKNALLLRNTLTQITEVGQRKLDFSRETGALEPMTNAAVTIQQAGEAEDAAGSQRVGNVWIATRDGRLVPKSRTLAQETNYDMFVMVGPAVAENIVDRPATIPEGELTKHYRDGRVRIRIVVHSNDVDLDEPVQTMSLPQPPSPSVPLRFRFKTKGASGEARIRVGFYHRNNLLQSVLVTALVEAHEVRRAGAIQGEAEWILTSSMKNLDRFGPKTLSILSNETPTGSHALAVVGSDFHQTYEFGEAEADRAIDRARGFLQWVCGAADDGASYKFEPDNAGNPEMFREHLASLASFGLDLYLKILAVGGPEFEDHLRNVLQHPSTIQAATMRSARRVFPWALVYDYPLIFDRSNTVCPEFLEIVERADVSADVIRKSVCFDEGCPHAENVDIVCPSGFWGFRHIVEQPLSAVAESRVANAASPTGAQYVREAISSIPGKYPQVLIGYSKRLSLYQRHCADLVAMLDHPRPQADFERNAIGLGLKREELSVVYFYCHGGVKDGRPWLGVGSTPEQQIFSNALYSWRVRWPDTHPLVFLNGCNTVGVSPDDLMTFNEQFARSMASGVVGTEVSIPETLGDYFGKAFMKALLRGDHVGTIIQDLRLSLLARRNPLGLVYTPYCLANLRLS